MLLEPLFETRATKQVLGHPQDPVLAHWFGADTTTAGVSVDENSAMNYSACWAATRIICGTGGMLPLKMYRRTRGGGKEEARDRPEWRIVHDRPNRRTSSMMFRASRLKFQVNSGNAYAEIERSNNGKIVALWQIHSSRVKPFYTEGTKLKPSELKYEIKNNDGTSVTMDADDVLHFPSVISDDGLIGKGVVAHARQSIGMGMATERHGAALFGNGARPGVVVEHPTRMSDVARTNFRKEWNEMYQGPENAHKMALLSEGAKLHEFGFSAEDSQFLETRQHNIEEVARWYGVPPHKIQHMLRSTFNNIEHQSIEFVQDCILPWLKIWEEELNAKLLSERDQETYFFEHCVDGLLRGDAYTRAQALQLQLQNGALNIDEWRAIENRNPLPDGSGQKHFIQLNMTTTDKAGEEQVASGVADKVDAIGEAQVEATKKADETYGRVLVLAEKAAENSSRAAESAAEASITSFTKAAVILDEMRDTKLRIASESAATRTHTTQKVADASGVIATSIESSAEQNKETLETIYREVREVSRREGERQETLFQACSTDFMDCLSGLMKAEQNELHKHARRKTADLKSLDKYAEKFYRTQQRKLEHSLARIERWWNVCDAGPRWNASEVAAEFVGESLELLRTAAIEAETNPKTDARTIEEKNALLRETVSNCFMKWKARPQKFTKRFIRKGEQTCPA